MQLNKRVSLVLLKSNPPVRLPPGRPLFLRGTVTKLKSDMRQILVSVLFLVHASLGYAQYTEKIVSGRPGQAIAAQTPGKNVFQLETGFDHTGADWVGDVDSDWNQRALLNATLLRFGILNKLEIHSGWEFRQDNWEQNEGDPTSAEGMSFSSVGIRHNIFEGDGKKPSLAYQVSAKLNILSKDYNPKGIAPHFVFTSGMSLTDKVGITLNSGINFGYKSSDFMVYIINFGYTLSDKAFAFTEIYGDFNISESGRGDKFNPKFDAGLGLFLTNDLQFDILWGYALNSDFQEYFVSTGLSWRLNHPVQIPEEPME